MNGSKVQAGRPPLRHALCWFMSILAETCFPDKACSDVWVSALVGGKSEKLALHHRRSFLPSLSASPTWWVFLLLAVQTDGAKSQTGAQTQVGRLELAGGQSDSRTWREHSYLSVGGVGRGWVKKLKQLWLWGKRERWKPRHKHKHWQALQWFLFLVFGLPLNQLNINKCKTESIRHLQLLAGWSGVKKSKKIIKLITLISTVPRDGKHHHLIQCLLHDRDHQDSKAPKWKRSGHNLCNKSSS